MKKNYIKKSLTVFSALVTALSLTGGLAVVTATEASVQKYEFEDGETSGGAIYNSLADVPADKMPENADFSGYSGNGFAYLDQKGTTLSVEVDVPEAGLYELSICYCEPSDPNKKVQYLNVNGVNQGEVSFPYNTSFEEASGGVVNLKEGKNIIELKAYWGYTYYDYLTIKPADKSLTSLSPTRTLSNPNASDSTKRLYNFLCDTYGNHIIAGQQEYCGSHNYNSWNDPDTFIKDNEAEFDYIKEQTGELPAIRGIDFLAYNTTSDWRDQAPERCIEWTNKYKGIATVTWHWNVPCEEGSTETAFYVESASATYTTFSISKALTEGTWENEVLMADIDLIAQELTKLKEADVPILWRPLHEAEGAWFWWGAEGPEPCKELYRLLYDKLTNEYGLDNLIWTWTSYTFPTSSAWYPGDDVVDLVGYDKYNAVDGLPNLSSISSTFYSLVQSTNGQKMVAMTENDSIPSLENLVNDKAAWLYFCPWYMNYLTSEQNNPVENLVEIYQSEYCITLDELPDLKTYPITEGENPQTTKTTTATKTTTKPDITTTTVSDDILYGDANCDGTVTIADAAAIFQAIGNADKYSLSEKGEKNADCSEPGGGITAADAIAIQKFDAKQIAELPEK
ncbi:MAG: glycoside hydrolase [Ruminococcus sp.]|nr:glycoside hydrolase [Ruminococcus sp.]